ncbi:MAG TPA: electron transfer flavoprotein subunit beta/FixA family protein [Thermodesulfobacteriota bacterium]|nr:electron transfer flavoprotein subunit beta/FixA family protein [Thermodesulfobacteriota bacterium]
MKITVCVKPAPDPKRWDSIQLDPVTKALRREGIPSILPPLDKRALEEGLRLKEKHGGTVRVFSMAPPSGRENLMEALAMGADEAFLLSDRSFAGSDTWATSLVLARGIQKSGPFDLVICGEWSLDGSTGHVGAQIAEFLGIPNVGRVVAVEGIDDGCMRTRSLIERGIRVMETSLPALITVTRDINQPRFTSLMGVMEAESKPCRILSASELGIPAQDTGFSGSPTQTGDVFMPDMTRRAEILDGEPEDMVKEIVRRIRQAIG